MRSRWSGLVIRVRYRLVRIGGSHDFRELSKASNQDNSNLDERIAQLITVARIQSIGSLNDEAFLNKVFQALQSHSNSFIDLGLIDQDGTRLAYVGPYAEQTANY